MTGGAGILSRLHTSITKWRMYMAIEHDYWGISTVNNSVWKSANMHIKIYVGRCANTPIVKHSYTALNDLQERIELEQRHSKPSSNKSRDPLM
jgi:hypothetical protein